MAGQKSMQIRHIIFDCDGVLVDSEPLSMRADVELLARHGIAMSEDEAHHRFVGKTFQAMISELEQEHGVTFPEGLSAEKDRRVEELYRLHLQPVPAIAAILQNLHHAGLGFSIASNSPAPRVRLAVELAGIAGYFDRITTKDDVPQGKPAPDVFLRAAALSGFANASCVAVEDSTTGVTAAVAAGLATIGYVGVHPDARMHTQKLLALGAVRVIDDMRQLPHTISSLA